MAIERVNVSTGQVPTEADWEDWLNRAIDKLNAGIAPADLVKDAAGKVEISITGDAATLNGKTADQIAAGDFPEVKKTLIDLITGGSGLVLKGGLATKNATIANQLDITACTVIQKVSSTGYIDRVDLPAASKTTTLANTTYYLDVIPGTVDYSWGTSHPAGDYVTLATVTTDASANIATVLDTRPLTATLLNGFDGKIIVPGANVSGDIPGGATATQANLDTHKTAATLDHPDASVTAAKLASGAALANLADGSISDAKIGSRTANQAITDAYSNTGTLTQLFSWIVKVIKELKGNVTNWYDAAAASISTIWSKFDPVTGHKHTGAAGDGPKLDYIPILTLFGDGSDGDVTIAANTTLTRDMFYNNLTINSGVTLNTANYRIFVKGTLTNNGTIACNGNNGNNGVSSAGSGVSGGAAVAKGWLRASGAGGNGGAHDSDPLATSGGSVTLSLGGSGGRGGDGYARPGAGGGSVTPPSPGWKLKSVLPLLVSCDANGALLTLAGGAGGGGGGNGESGGTAAGAGGGSGGGIVAIFSDTLVINGSIQAKGGDGGTGYPSGSSTGTGGGGGGGGGAVMLVYKTKSGAGTINVSGGSAGAGGVVAAQPGSPGQVIEIVL
jgi:hypothetical protein